MLLRHGLVNQTIAEPVHTAGAVLNASSEIAPRRLSLRELLGGETAAQLKKESRGAI